VPRGPAPSPHRPRPRSIPEAPPPLEALVPPISLSPFLDGVRVGLGWVAEPAFGLGSAGALSCGEILGWLWQMAGVLRVGGGLCWWGGAHLSQQAGKAELS